MNPGAFEAYCAFWQSLRPESVERLDEVAVPGFRFSDPFHDLSSREQAKAMLHRMFRRVKAPRFEITGRAMDGDAGYIRWRFSTGSGFAIEGMSEVRFGHDGLAVSHTDHWDAARQFYGKIPLLGCLLRALGRLV